MDDQSSPYKLWRDYHEAFSEGTQDNKVTSQENFQIWQKFQETVQGDSEEDPEEDPEDEPEDEPEEEPEEEPLENPQNDSEDGQNETTDSGLKGSLAAILNNLPEDFLENFPDDPSDSSSDDSSDDPAPFEGFSGNYEKNFQGDDQNASPKKTEKSSKDKSQGLSDASTKVQESSKDSSSNKSEDTSSKFSSQGRQPKQSQDDKEKQSKDDTKPKSKLDPAFKLPSPLEAIDRDRGVPRPDIFDEVSLGPYVSSTDAKIAYKVWSLPDAQLGKAYKKHTKRPYLRSKGDISPHVLSHNIYEHLMSDPLLPVNREQAVAKFEADILENDWDAGEIIDEFAKSTLKESSIANIDSWRTDKIKTLLESRGLSTLGEKQDLIKRAQKSELETHFGIMPQSDLTHWGIERKLKYKLQPVDNPQMTTLDMYTFAVHLSPYNPAYWTSRAYCHYQRAFFDLALGDAYRAKLLCDILCKSTERSRQPGLYPRIWHAIEQHLLASPWSNGGLKTEVQRLRDQGPSYFTDSLMKTLEHIMQLSLAALGSWHDLHPKYNIVNVGTRFLSNGRDSIVPELRGKLFESVQKSHEDIMDETSERFWHEKFQGRVAARRRYPYDPIDTDQLLTDQKFVETINKNLFKKIQGDEFDPKELCQAALSAYGSVAVFAVRDIKAGEMIFYEEPTIRGHLQPLRMKRDNSTEMPEPRCENCQRIVEITEDLPRCECFPEEHDTPGPDDRVFCNSTDDTKLKSCKFVARFLHHFNSCGKDWSWLYDAMRPVIKWWDEKEYIVRCNDMYGTMHSLLLRSIFEITLRRRRIGHADLSPMELNELLLLHDDSDLRDQDWFPFSFIGNITVPFDILTCLGVDIFRDLSFDTWVIQKILRKLLHNAIPWDPERRGHPSRFLLGDRDKTPEELDEQDQRIEEKESFKEWDPSFVNLYVFPGLNMFRQAYGERNAKWGYDSEVPNRIVVWALYDIKKGEEITFRDRHRDGDAYYAESSSNSDEEPVDNRGKKKKTKKTKKNKEGKESKESKKRKSSEHAKVEDSELVFYREVKDATLPPGRKRRRHASKKNFHYSPTYSGDYAELHAELFCETVIPGEGSERRKVRMAELAKDGIGKYRENQRRRIDKADREAGRPRRYRMAHLENPIY